jgi:tRNA threonylcarbamoyladenosine biosynthesis protein TsaE
MTDVLQVSLHNEEEMIEFGHRIAEATAGDAVIFLLGDLGMGKTTLSRGILRGMGHQGSVKSPTYTLVEPYEIGDKRVYHFDLYRLADPEELEYLGIRDYFDDQSLCLVEWPDKGRGVLPKPDLILDIALEGRGRCLSFRPQNPRGEAIVSALRMDSTQ